MWFIFHLGVWAPPYLVIKEGREVRRSREERKEKGVEG